MIIKLYFCEHSVIYKHEKITCHFHYYMYKRQPSRKVHYDFHIIATPENFKFGHKDYNLNIHFPVKSVIKPLNEY